MSGVMVKQYSGFPKITEIELWHGNTLISEYFSTVDYFLYREVMQGFRNFDLNIKPRKRYIFDDALVTKNKAIEKLKRFNNKKVNMFLKTSGGTVGKIRGILNSTVHFDNPYIYNIIIEEE